MFTGIVESLGQIVDIQSNGSNKTFVIHSALVPELKVDQSVSHNGVCLTVEKLDPDMNHYHTTAIHETLSKTTLDQWKTGDRVNLERAVTMEQRLDGHFVQGHVDGIVLCVKNEDLNGSMVYTFDLPENSRHLLIPQGSVTLDGISLTVAYLSHTKFSVAIIPYTLEHTTAQLWAPGKTVNVEYDVFGKYLDRYRELYQTVSLD